jgi:hypothetical protein
MCFGALIGFFNSVKLNSLLAIEDYCLALKDVLMDRVPCCPSIIPHKEFVNNTIEEQTAARISENEEADACVHPRTGELFHFRNSIVKSFTQMCLLYKSISVIDNAGPDRVGVRID